MGNTVAISGAGGFIGSHVMEAFLAQDYNVVAIVRDKKALDSFKCRQDIFVVESDFSNQQEISSALAKRDCDCMLHLAWSGVDGASNGQSTACEQIDNIKRACIAARASVEADIRTFIFCGSDWQYKIRVNDSLSKGTYDYYGSAKQCAADMCRLICDDGCISYYNVLPANVFGPGDVSRRSINTFILKMLNNEPLDLIEYSMLKDWVYVKDIAQAFVELSKSMSSDEYEVYFGHERLSQFGDLVTLLKKCIGSSSILNFGKYLEQTKIDSSFIDTRALGRITGFSLSYELESRLEETVSWQRARFKKEGLL